MVSWWPGVVENLTYITVQKITENSESHFSQKININIFGSFRGKNVLRKFQI